MAVVLTLVAFAYEVSLLLCIYFSILPKEETPQSLLQGGRHHTLIRRCCAWLLLLLAWYFCHHIVNGKISAKSSNWAPDSKTITFFVCIHFFLKATQFLRSQAEIWAKF